MKQTSAAIFVVAVGVALGAGVYMGKGAIPSHVVPTGLAILTGANLLLCVFLWARAKPGSGDAMFLPGFILMLALVLLGNVPPLLWPAAERTNTALQIVSIVAMAALLLRDVIRRRRRRLRRDAL